MKVFVAGATGALGRRLVPLLVERGHEVVGTTRTPGKADALRAAGARLVRLESLSQPACSSKGRMLSTRSVNG
jgi:uncharacterized protein YbjT (DUF2867 family)